MRLNTNDAVSIVAGVVFLTTVLGQLTDIWAYTQSKNLFGRKLYRLNLENDLKKILYVDMDNVLVDFSSGILQLDIQCSTNMRCSGGRFELRIIRQFTFNE